MTFENHHDIIHVNIKISVKFLDNQTKAMQVLQYELVLHKEFLSQEEANELKRLKVEEKDERNLRIALSDRSSTAIGTSDRKWNNRFFPVVSCDGFLYNTGKRGGLYAKKNTTGSLL